MLVVRTFILSDVITDGHFKKSCPPCFELVKFNRIPLAIPVLKPGYENTTLPLSHM